MRWTLVWTTVVKVFMGVSVMDAHGKSMTMSDDEQMALGDGRVVMMKNNKV